MKTNYTNLTKVLINVVIRVDSDDGGHKQINLWTLRNTSQSTSEWDLSDQISGCAQDSFGGIQTCTWCRPLVIQPLSTDVNTRSEQGHYQTPHSEDIHCTHVV